MNATPCFYLTDLDFSPRRAWRFKEKTFPRYFSSIWLDFMVDGQLMQGNTLTGEVRHYKVSFLVRLENLFFVHVFREKKYA